MSHIDYPLDEQNYIHSYRNSGMKVKIANLTFNVMSFRELIDCLVKMANQHELYYVSTCAAYSFAIAHEDDRVKDALAEAHFLLADGMPLVWVQRGLGYYEAERLYGPDILWAVCRATAHQPVRHYFYGGKDKTAQRLAERLLTHFPDLEVCGYSEPPNLPEREIFPDEETISMLNQSKADIIWVGLGAPKQDIWMQVYRPFLQAPLLIGVGAAFDFVSGNKRQAPYVIQRIGLEWLFRLIHEPQRLWRRYLIYNLRFLMIILRWIVFKGWS